MNEKTPRFKWKKQSLDHNCEIIECPAYDAYKDFRMDPSGYYVLIRLDRTVGKIEVAICTKDHQIIKIFRGKTAQELYHHIFTAEKKAAKPWFDSKDHIAYLGKELRKAELALENDGQAYLQE